MHELGIDRKHDDARALKQPDVVISRQLGTDQLATLLPEGGALPLGIPTEKGACWIMARDAAEAERRDSTAQGAAHGADQICGCIEQARPVATVVARRKNVVAATYASARVPQALHIRPCLRRRESPSSTPGHWKPNQFRNDSREYSEGILSVDKHPVNQAVNGAIEAPAAVPAQHSLALATPGRLEREWRIPGQFETRCPERNQVVE